MTLRDYVFGLGPRRVKVISDISRNITIKVIKKEITVKITVKCP